MRFVIVECNLAILEVRDCKRGDEEPFRVITGDRASMVMKNGHVLPTRLSVTNHSRGTTTEVVMTQLRINPQIDEHAFSIQALESQRPLALGGP